jgi:hypothetical protein
MTSIAVAVVAVVIAWPLGVLSGAVLAKRNNDNRADIREAQRSDRKHSNSNHRGAWPLNRRKR